MGGGGGVGKYNIISVIYLESEEQEEGHHKTEETHGLWEGKAEDGVREELLLEGWVPGVPDDQGPEDGPNTGTGPGSPDGGGSGTDQLSGGVNVPGGSGGLEATHHNGGEDGPDYGLAAHL